MKKRLQIMLEMAGFLLLSLMIPTVAVLIWLLFAPERPENISHSIRGLMVITLLFCGFPGLVSFYLFQHQDIRQRLFTPTVTLLLEVLWVLLIFSGNIHGLFAVIVLFFPAIGVVIATILAARLPRFRNHNHPIKNSELIFVNVVELLFGILIPIFALQVLGQCY